MICKKCADAADRRADVSEHCNRYGTWCDCAHRPVGALFPEGVGEVVHEILKGPDPAVGPPYTHTFRQHPWRPRQHTWLTSASPEPPPGATVVDENGVRWYRAYDQETDGAANWCGADRGGWMDGDPETWTKIAGNYGPVRLLEDS